MLKPTWRIPSLRCDKMKWWRSDWVVFQDRSLFDMQVENIFLPKGLLSLEEEWTYNIVPHCPSTKCSSPKSLSAVSLLNQQVLILSVENKPMRMGKKSSHWGPEQSGDTPMPLVNLEIMFVCCTKHWWFKPQIMRMQWLLLHWQRCSFLSVFQQA